MNRVAEISPSAFFVIERLPTKGYQVKSADGPRAAEWKDKARELLDLLGQPDPTGPSEQIRLVGPVGATDQYVTVVMKLKENGEAVYNQAWFLLAKPEKRRSWRVICLLFTSLVLAIGTAVAAGVFLPTESQFVRSHDASGTNILESNKSADNRKIDRDSVEYIKRVKPRFAKHRVLWLNMRDYLEQYLHDQTDSVGPVDEDEVVARISDFFEKRGTPKSIRHRDLKLTRADIEALKKALDDIDELIEK